MARGLSREQSKEKNLKKTKAGASKGNTEGLTPQARAERCVPRPVAIVPPAASSETNTLHLRPPRSLRIA